MAKQDAKVDGSGGGPADKPPKRRPFRREQILEAAVRLFNERGYHSTGMNDIGAAVGITGPGIYRHFKNKEDILETALLEAGQQMHERVQKLVAEADTAEERLDRLVDNYIDVLLTYPALSVTVLSELNVLSPSARAWIIRNTRLHVEEWVTALLEVRPDLTETEARVLVWGVFGLWHSIDRYHQEMGRERLAAMIRRMAMALLFSEIGAEAGVGVA
jgi:AcrR family transcriptional regulator